MNLSIWNRAIVAELIAKSCQDIEFRREFLANPAKCLVEAGAKIPSSAEIAIVENSPSAFNIVLPPFSKESHTLPFIEAPKELGAAIYSLIRRATFDEEFRKNFVSEPAKFAKEAGVELPSGIELKVFEEEENVLRIVLPNMPAENALGYEELRKVVGGAYIVTFDSSQVLNTVGNYSFVNSATTQYTFMYAGAMQNLQILLYSNNAVSSSSSATAGNSNSSASVAWLQVVQDVYLETTVAVQVEEAQSAITTTTLEFELEVGVEVVAVIVMT